MFVVDDADYLIEVLIQKSLSEPDAGVGEEGIDPSSFGRCIEDFHPLNRSKVGLNRLNICSHIAEMLRRRASGRSLWVMAGLNAFSPVWVQKPCRCCPELFIPSRRSGTRSP